MLRALLLVGFGGGVGSIFRYLTSIVTTKYLQTSFPWATFGVNITGCLIIGLLAGLLSRQLLSDNLKFLLITGFCGGFTTFSAFSAENVSLFQSGNAPTALLYIAASISFGLAAVWLGLFLTR